MAVQLFGFEISKKGEEKQQGSLSLYEKQDDGVGYVWRRIWCCDLEGNSKSEAELVTRYREMAMRQVR